ncbi:UDP-N-acetylmuramate dehydrogenase [Budvicia aquatica]|uniref:UDP-N-acetylenolpyruvoylglucosamine reductase n=1 Tax=Budvicia aquatica TaxID=82979 RepID=A0A2C6DIT5_9GAMM|nr:UDP-N-acetylmuramate dehydrogenase [Budvicia aquatica]PHI28663.1 UDP-N-acetylmuramate dehydrogenase [Budvicia aquatica]GKX53310.1 UDP-N-acetylenolpyruvoylglucosamine reductase [Budvicia aquatica]VFS46683.1 UDP-N-acetylenolpyruvoylglucosamine reductase [Budvicia aquatica]
MSSSSVSIQALHTFGLPVRAERVIFAESPQQLVDAWQQAEKGEHPVLLLGEGSNMLFLEDFSGWIILNRIKGINVRESDDAWHLHIGAGENWHELVRYTLEHNFSGLENLALIPGCVGSSPIQNIGAYGVELKDVCEYVDVLDLASGDISRIAAADCQFGYRDSVFKHQFRDGYAIVAVGLVLDKVWKPVLSYGDLRQFDSATVTPKQVFDSVCAMRSSKLPDPKITGNAGSFFKNPIVSAQVAAQILAEYPNAPHYPQPDGQEKLAAGWLIDMCQLKGYRIGGAAVHQQQALVLINLDHATSLDVTALAGYVRQQVAERFNVWLEPEVRFIGPSGERNAVEVLS